MTFSENCDSSFLHGLEESRLCLRRGAVDLVSEDDVGEDRAGQELELTDAGGLILLDDLCAGDVRGHQVGCELDALEIRPHALSECFNSKRLGETGYSFQEYVTIG